MLVKKEKEVGLGKLVLFAGNINADCVEDVHPLTLVFDCLPCIFTAQSLHCLLNDRFDELQGLVLSLLITCCRIGMVLIELLEGANIIDAFIFKFAEVLILRFLHNILIHVYLRQYVIKSSTFKID